MVACLLGSYWKWQEPCPHRITFWVVISFGNGTQSYIDDSPIRELQNRTLFHPVPMEQISRLRHPPSSDKPKLIQMTYDLEYVCWTVPNLFFQAENSNSSTGSGSSAVLFFHPPGSCGSSLSELNLPSWATEMLSMDADRWCRTGA